MLNSFDDILHELVKIHPFFQKEANFDWTNTIDNSNNQWLLANVQQFGYYRVNYEEGNWRALINQLKVNYAVSFPVLPVIHRNRLDVSHSFICIHVYM